MLPVLELENQIVAQLATSNRLVLAAPTGSGKTTQVPQILDRMAGLSGDLIVLQPRRLATRMVARRVAEEMGVQVGGRVGYQTRHEKQIGPKTRIRFMTEGLLLRRMANDPHLKGIGAVVLDEFHERSLAADTVLGLVKGLQESKRPELKLIVMSATLDTQRIGEYLKCEALEAGGRLYPVREEYVLRPNRDPIWDQAANALERSVEEGVSGDVLIFMPGVFEINKTITACKQVLGRLGESADVLPLHGSLKPQQQDAAVQTSRSGQRKVIVSTNVAETSITIDGIGCVIDSGQARMNRYDGLRGLNVLKVEAISRASADQRRGRAGRTGPGVCYRLWTKSDQASRDAFDEPEVRRVELAAAVLQLVSMGARNVGAFDWLDAPEAQTLQRGVQLLVGLGALDDVESLTEMGRQMAKFPAHPRLARMLIEAGKRGCLSRAVVWAALIGERDIVLREGGAKLKQFCDPAELDSDLALRERAFEAARRARFDVGSCSGMGVNAGACRDVDRAVKQLGRLCEWPKKTEVGEVGGEHEELVQCLLAGYPDHLASLNDVKRRICVMPGRKRVALDRGSRVETEGVIVAVGMSEVGRGDSSQTMLSLASLVHTPWLEEAWPERVSVNRIVRWCDQTEAMRVYEERVLAEWGSGNGEGDGGGGGVRGGGGIVLGRKELGLATAAEAEPEMVRRIMGGALALTHWDEAVLQWIQRVKCVSEWFPERELLPYSDEDIELLLHEIVAGEARFGRVRDRACLDVVRNALEWDDQQFVEKQAPDSIRLPSGYRMKIEYRSAGAPVGRAKVQQLYNVDQTPRVASGRIELLLEILAPNYRPVQTTSDLAGFWKGLYPELKKELRRRYPKHEWR